MFWPSRIQHHYFHAILIWLNGIFKYRTTIPVPHW
jgi:hypothetical protein